MRAFWHFLNRRIRRLWRRWSTLVALQLDPQWHDMYALGIDIKVLTHEASVVVTGCHQTVDDARVGP